MTHRRIVTLPTLLLLVVITILIWATVPVSAGVQGRDLDCANFDSRQDAQDALEENPNYRSKLDPDNDGAACEQLAPGVRVISVTSFIGILASALVAGIALWWTLRRRSVEGAPIEQRAIS